MEFVKTKHSLAKTNSDKNDPLLAKMLSNLPVVYYRTHQNKKVEETMLEAVKIYRYLFGINLKEYYEVLVLALKILSSLYKKENRLDEAKIFD